LLGDSSFRGMLCAVYFGERLAAARFGLRSGNVLHGSIMAYNPELASYSPGSILLVQTARAAQDLGISRIDLGKGPEQYKQQFKSGETTVAEGAVDMRLTATIRKGWRCTREIVRASPLRAPAQRVIRSARAWLIYR
jgi:CelD/BcsL family acetyltransferase involved in cellulose biosynthesis